MAWEKRQGCWYSALGRTVSCEDLGAPKANHILQETLLQICFHEFSFCLFGCFCYFCCFPNLPNSPHLTCQDHTMILYSSLKTHRQGSNSELAMRFKIFNHRWGQWFLNPTASAGCPPWPALPILMSLPMGSSSFCLTSWALNPFYPGWGPKPLSKPKLRAYSKTINGLELTFLPYWLLGSYYSFEETHWLA